MTISITVMRDPTDAQLLPVLRDNAVSHAWWLCDFVSFGKFIDELGVHEGSRAHEWILTAFYKAAPLSDEALLKLWRSTSRITNDLMVVRCSECESWNVVLQPLGEVAGASERDHVQFALSDLHGVAGCKHYADTKERYGFGPELYEW